MAHLSSSEDEFPDVEVILQRRNQDTTCTDHNGDEQKVSRQARCSKSTQPSPDVAVGKTPATTRRRRKLGQGQQPVDHALLKPWEGKAIEKEANSRVSRSRQTSTELASEKEETSSTSAAQVAGRLPAKTKAAESRVVTSSTVFDNSPEEPKKTRRLISRGEKKALELRVVQKELDSLLSSAESESDAASCSQDDDSDFIVRGDSESEDLSPPSPRRSESPSGPRRLQRRVLSSSREPAAWMKPRQDEPKALSEDQQEKRDIAKKPSTRKAKPASKGDLEDFFKELKISYEESESEEPATGAPKIPSLDPVTPKKKITASPGKVPRIPMSPWKPEHKEFWDPEVNFAWIDKHSPPKKSPKKAVLDLTAPDAKDELKRKYGTSPEKKQAKKAFDAVKEDLARDFLLELDEVVTDGKLGRLTEATGGLRIVWSNTLLTTAGRAHWKCKTTTTTSRNPSGSHTGNTASGTTSTASAGAATTTTKSTTAQHYAHIELAVKVLSNESDLLNTVAHEFCHLAVFILHGKPKQAHGAEFKAYGQRVMRASTTSSTAVSGSGSIKALKTPRSRGVEISVTTRHSYEIEYRFVWRCADCGGEVHRHSRSVDPVRHRCGRCKKGVLVQVKPVPRGGGGGGAKTTGKGSAEGEEGEELGSKIVGSKGMGVQQQKGVAIEKRKKTAYQEFTSLEMKALSITHKNLSFGEKMALVSARWKTKTQTQTAAEGIGAGRAGTGTAVSTSANTTTTTAVSVRGLAAAIDVLGLDDDGSDN